jgi:DNA-binding HxlR family transcriptional regulator/putative sterol carrier protein
MKVKRSYEQYCPAAKALDLVGERWTLLVVRELLLGPRRYGDLIEALPGIGTNLLAERLRRLEDAGFVQRRRLDPPAGSTVYQLTERGAGLEDVVLALARVGMAALGQPRREETFRPEWLTLTLRANFDPDAAHGVRETYELRVDGQPVHVRVDRGRVEARSGPAAEPDLVLEAKAPALARLGRGELEPEEALTSGALRVSGDPGALLRFLRVFRLGRTAAA